MFPKVCYGCAMPHILDKEDEVLSKDGSKSFHKKCYTEDEKGVTYEFVANVKEEVNV